MKKTSLLYAAACLLSGMTLFLSSCSDDDPIDSTTDTMPWENGWELQLFLPARISMVSMKKPMRNKSKTSKNYLIPQATLS